MADTTALNISRFSDTRLPRSSPSSFRPAQPRETDAREPPNLWLMKYSKDTQTDTGKSQRPEAGGYSFAEVVTGLCRGTLYALVHQRRIPHVRLSARLVRFRRDELEGWMNARAVPTGDAE